MVAAGQYMKCLAGDDDAVAPVGAAIDHAYFLCVVAIDIKCMAEQLHLLERFFVVHGLYAKGFGTDDGWGHKRRLVCHGCCADTRIVALSIAPVAPFVAFYLFADRVDCGIEGLHEFVGFFFGAQEYTVFAGDGQLDAVVLVLLADIDGDGLDGGQVASEDGEFCFDSAAGLGAEVTMLGANNKLHNASQLNQCTPGVGY